MPCARRDEGYPKPLRQTLSQNTGQDSSLITYTRAKTLIFQPISSSRSKPLQMRSMEKESSRRFLEAELTREANSGIYEQESSRWLHCYHFTQTGFPICICKKQGSQQRLSLTCSSKFFLSMKEHRKAETLQDCWPKSNELAFSIWPNSH